ncbi:MAG: outer membrane protein assembly factor BamD [Ignavibacteriales bacterium]|nr:outer membrane protein assembly factor BamD [Ignavibacteriales bacterium]
MRKIIYLFIGLISVIIIGCSSSDLTKNMSAEERFAIGKQMFEEEDYLEAKKEFEMIKLQFPGSSVADDAQYYLAECYFMREEYLLASEEYKSIKRSLQGSPYLPLAQFKIAMSFYNLAPISYLDQEYTLKAIDAFQTFIEYYPTNDSVSVASAKIKELNTRLAQKDFDSAEMYMQLGYYKAAAYYYNNVAEKFHDTPAAEPSHFGLVKALIARKKYDDAKKEVEKFLEKYPRSQFKSDAESLKKDIDEKIKSQSAAYFPNQQSQVVK